MRSARIRRQNGNIIALVSFMIAVTAVLFLIAMSYGGLVFMQNRVRASADEIALVGARKLNEMDRIGQMNNMVARCRQLVFSSSKQYNEALSLYPQISNLAKDLYDETKLSAVELESQRHHLRQVAEAEAKDAMQQKFLAIMATYPMDLPWLSVEIPVMDEFKVGKLKDVQSNVERLKNIDELVAYDQSQSYVSSDPGLKLYRESIDAKLPGADSSLTFKLASLAPPVENSVSPARMVLAGLFADVPGDQLPSATKVKISLAMSTGLGPHAENTMSAEGTASATGACPQM